MPRSYARRERPTRGRSKKTRPQEQVHWEENGTVTVNFGSNQRYKMRSCMHPTFAPTTLFITDVPDQLNPDYHPLHGKKGANRVWRGWFYWRPDGVSSREGWVAVKWYTGKARRDRLEIERGNYSLLSQIQGSVIPRLLDYLEGSVEDINIACMVLEWCGAKLTENKRTLGMQKLEQAIAFHHEGVRHGHLLEDDTYVAVKKTEPVITDDYDQELDRGFVRRIRKVNPLRIIGLAEVASHSCPYHESHRFALGCPEIVAVDKKRFEYRRVLSSS